MAAPPTSNPRVVLPPAHLLQEAARHAPQSAREHRMTAPELHPASRRSSSGGRHAAQILSAQGTVKFTIDDPRRRQYGMMAVPGLERDIFVPFDMTIGLLRGDDVWVEYNTRDSIYFAWKVWPLQDWLYCLA